MAGEVHEERAKLSAAVLNRHRAIASLMEEMEAVDWYDQRSEAATDPELKAILEHNRDEEKEHAAMIIEWLRRNDPAFEEELKTYLFKSGPIDHHGEEEAEETPPSGGDLGLGNLKGES